MRKIKEIKKYGYNESIKYIKEVKIFYKYSKGEIFNLRTLWSLYSQNNYNDSIGLLPFDFFIDSKKKLIIFTLTAI